MLDTSNRSIFDADLGQFRDSVRKLFTRSLLPIWTATRDRESSIAHSG